MAQSQVQIQTENISSEDYPDFITLIYYQRHTCSKRSVKKEFNMLINERTREIKPAWEVWPVLEKEYGSRCSGEVYKGTTLKHVLEKAKEGWTIVKFVQYHWHAGRRDVTVTYYHIPSRQQLEYERDYEHGEYFDRVMLPDGRAMRVYKDRVEFEG